MKSFIKLLSVGLSENLKHDNLVASSTSIDTESKLPPQIPFLIVKDGVIIYVPFRFVN
jgi:hypothetical protein